MANANFQLIPLTIKKDVKNKLSISTALIPFWRLSPLLEIISKIGDFSISITGDCLRFWKLEEVNVHNEIENMIKIEPNHQA